MSPPADESLDPGAPVPRSCPACDGWQADHVGRAKGYVVNSCRRCKTLFVGDTAVFDTPEDYDRYYSDANLSAPEFVNISLDRTVRRFEPYRRSNRLLDAGFGSGLGMQAARRAGWDAEGVEVSGPAVEHARKLGFEVFHGDASRAGHPDGHFDVVLLSEVLEHVPDPRVLVGELIRVLRPGGLLWATTPHGRGISSRVLGLDWSLMAPPEHLQLFSIAGVKEILRSAGFSEYRIHSRSVNPIELVRHFRPAAGDGEDGAGFNRVQSSYAMLETAYRRRSVMAGKQLVDVALRAGRMGDSLRIWATKS